MSGGRIRFDQFKDIAIVIQDILDGEEEEYVSLDFSEDLQDRLLVMRIDIEKMGYNVNLLDKLIEQDISTDTFMEDFEE